MEPPRTPIDPKPSDSYLKYGSFALQLLGGVGFAAWAGHRLDQYFQLKFPAFLLTFVFVVFGTMLFQTYRKFNQEK